MGSRWCGVVWLVMCACRPVPVDVREVPFVPALAETPTGWPPVEPATPPNVLLIVLDDIGIDQLRPWEVFGSDPAAYPKTPTLDGLADGGVRFANAYAMPLCSTARATLLTGRYPHRHGVGFALELEDPGALPDREITIPEMLDAGAPDPWSNAWLGKWHLANWETGPWDAPLRQGFQEYAGSIGNLYAKYTSDNSNQSYVHWEKNTDGELAWTDTYATTDTIDDAVVRVTTLPEPWFVGVALNTAHDPFKMPPAGSWSGVTLGDNDTQRNYHAMIENADTEIERLVASVDLEHTVIIVVGDNGTPSAMATAWERPGRMKETVYEMGVRVPLIVAGPPVAEPGSPCDALVSIADLFATIAEVAGAVPDPEVPLDSVSLVPYLADPRRVPMRDTVFAETFKPPGFEPHVMHRRMVREARYKLVQQLGEDDELYDLGVGLLDDGPDLLRAPEPLDEAAAAAYDRLLAAVPTPLGE